MITSCFAASSKANSRPQWRHVFAPPGPLSPCVGRCPICNNRGTAGPRRTCRFPRPRPFSVNDSQSMRGSSILATTGVSVPLARMSTSYRGLARNRDCSTSCPFSSTISAIVLLRWNNVSSSSSRRSSFRSVATRISLFRRRGLVGKAEEERGAEDGRENAFARPHQPRQGGLVQQHAAQRLVLRQSDAVGDDEPEHSALPKQPPAQAR